MKGQIATLIAQQQAAQAAAIKAALAQLANQGNGASSVPASDVGGSAIPNLPAPSPRAAAAIAYAEAQLGKPYIWGGNGPVGYDCSGLALASWENGRWSQRSAAKR